MTKVLNYHNDPTFSNRYSKCGQSVKTQTLRSSLVWVYTVCRSGLHLLYSKLYVRATLFKFEDNDNNFNQHLPNGLVYPYQLDKSISNLGVSGVRFSFLFYFEEIFLLANSKDLDQTPRSDLGLHSRFTYVSKIGR